MDRKDFYIEVAEIQLKTLAQIKLERKTSAERSHIAELGSHKFSGIIDCAIHDSELDETEFREVSKRIHELESKLWNTGN